MATDPRFLTESGREVFTGNELLVKGALETEGGVHLMTGYPGSPVSGFFDILGDIKDVLQSHGVRAFQANNEALGAAAVNGSQMAPCRAIATMKSVGVHVASDALALGNMAGAHPQGGAVIIMGDDPWCDSTQVPADSRFLCEHLRMPVVEPEGPQELKDWIGQSFKLSQAAGLYIGYIVTTAQADGGGTVDCRPNQFPVVNTQHKVALDTARVDLGRVLLPPKTWLRELETPARFAKTIIAARELGLNRIDKGTRGVNDKETRGQGDRQRRRQSDGGTTPVGNPAAPSSSSLSPGPLVALPPSVPASQAPPLSPCPSSVPVSPGPLVPLSPSAPPSPLGFIVTGMSGPYLRHVLFDLGLSGVFPILNMGMSYPADVELVAEFSRLCDKMIVIEERRSFLEKNIRDGLSRELPAEEAAQLSPRLFGKSFPNGLQAIPETRGLNPSVLAQILIPLIKATEQIPAELRNGRLTAELDRIRKVSKPKLQVITDQIIARTPTFCPGCPHRDSSAALLQIRKDLADPKYMLEKHGSAPVDLVAHGDTGCYTMLMFAPTEQLMHNYSGMGLGGGTGTGIDPFITNKQIVFMGDGTFFHSGQIAISNSIKVGQDITYIILENKTTAMTGHQEHAGTEMDVLGNRSYIQDIDAIVRGMAGSSPLTVEKLSPADRDKYRKVLESTILRDGVKVIIADKECGITYNRRVLKEERKVVKKYGYLPQKTHMNVTPEVCENCLECTKQTACPGLTNVETHYGAKIDTDLTWCVNDGACERVRVSNEAGINVKPCPSFEQVTVIRRRRRRYTLPHMALDKLPEPQRVHPMEKPGDAWRAHMAGVGGMGIGVVNAILVRAGHKEGYRVIFADKKGLAIRNGGVYSQITFVKEDEDETRSGEEAGRHEGTKARSGGEDVAPRSLSPSSPPCLRASVPACLPPETTGHIPYGRADLLFGVDILEATRATDARDQFRIASPERTCAVLNTYRQPTVSALLGKQDFDPELLRAEIFEHCRPEHSFAQNLSEVCEQRLGSKLYVNIMMLGVAYQCGLVPVSARSIAWAIKDSIRREHRKNLKAFNIGRKIALEPRALPRKPAPETWEQLLTNKSRILRRTRMFGPALAMKFEKMVQGAMKQMRDLPEQAKFDLALRIYDVMQYQSPQYAKRYIEAVRGVYRRDNPERRYAATIAVIWNLAKVTLIKDEPYVSYLLTRYEKKHRDISKYGVDMSNGDRLIYRHHTNPEFNIGRRRIRVKITTRDWQLKLVSHCRWWRKLPGWHKHEVAFRDWYVGLLSRVNLSTDYDKAVRVLKSPEEVTGYREVRYPKQDRARQRVEAELGPVPSLAPPEPKSEIGSVLDALGTPTRV
jgi:indolepyruvate ferredoxin oxidoreductase